MEVSDLPGLCLLSSSLSFGCAPPLPYRAAKTRPINLSRLLGAFTPYRECIRPKATTFSISKTLTLPFRFQRPPPILSL